MKKSNPSYNSGQPVTKLVVPTLSQSINLFDKLRKSGQVFRADFIKRGDGSVRTMVCRCGVKKYLKGGKVPYKFSDKGLLPVWEFGNGYRSIAIDNIRFIKFGGVMYAVNSTATPGEYFDMARTLKSQGVRTPNAKTSPLLEQVAV